MRNQILEKISWIPYRLKSRLIFNKKNPHTLDFKKLDLNKKFQFYILEKDEGLSNQLRAFGFREPLNMKYSYLFVSKEDKVLDIGANLGLFSLLSCNAKKIISIEPITECIPVLKKNLQRNGLLKKSTIINMAVGKKGKLILKKEGKINLSKVTDKKGKDTIEIESDSLKYFAEKYNANFLRMDVEGYEYDILMNKIPKNIKKIAMEFHTTLLGKKRVLELMRYFDKESFRVKYFIEDLPIRLYPFYSVLKKLNLLGVFTYVLENKKPLECINYLNKGRHVKYLFLER